MSDPSASPTPSRPRCRIVVIDSDRRVRDSLAALLELSPDLEMVGTASRAEDAYTLAVAQLPDVVVVDPRLPDDRTGLDLVARLRAAWPAICIVVAGTASEGAADALACGADEFVPKAGGVEAFMAAIVRAATRADRGAVLDEALR